MHVFLIRRLLAAVPVIVVVTVFVFALLSLIADPQAIDRARLALAGAREWRTLIRSHHQPPDRDCQCTQSRRRGAAVAADHLAFGVEDIAAAGGLDDDLAAGLVDGLVGQVRSDRSALPALLRVGFSGPSPEPDVRLPPHPALH